MGSSREWSESQFGHADLGDVRRTARLVELAAEVAGRPAGTVIKSCGSSASREGAFRLLENGSVRPDAVREAMQQAAARACRDLQQVVVPIDSTSLSLSEGIRKKGLGGVGRWDRGARGVHVMTALALTADGVPLGICSQRMWIRDARSVIGDHGARGRLSENRFWLELLREAQGEIRAAAPHCRPWFQMDRGADCWQVLASSTALGITMTVRATHDRRTDNDAGRLWATVEQARAVAKQKILVPARPPAPRKKRVAGKHVKYFTPRRATRIATVVVRAATVPVLCKLPNGREVTIAVNAVFVREINGPSNDRLEWLLLTTHPVTHRSDVLEVVRNYALRWRIEDFHRLWKRGLCRVEDTQLRSRDAIFKWATILAAVATRAARLTQLARTTPDLPASTEFSSHELAALFALRQPKGFDHSAVPTLAVAVRWIADLGGYTGPWNGPPGATVIGRGLHDVLVTARAFEFEAQK
jgi:hypothetical protein